MFGFTGLPDVRCNICHKGIGHQDEECHIVINRFTYILCEECYAKYNENHQAMLDELERQHKARLK